MEVNVTATSTPNVFNVTVEQVGSGSQGPKGDPGKSAYEIAVDNGFVGTESEWLASLVGPQGIPGTDGADGAQGIPGTKGEQGEPGADGMSAYEIWLSQGDVGTEQDFLDSLVGPQGIQGIQGVPGQDGADGVSPHIDETTGNWFIGTTDTGVHAEGPQGEQGIQGEPGAPGADGQDVEKFYGTLAQYEALPADKLTNGVEHFIEADQQP